jgi:hypothetical protein
MNTIQIASTFAVVTGLAGLIPQIWAMTSSRSSLGQSPTGWTLGIGVNVLMGYVNLVAYDARGLALGNAIGMLLCSIALTAVLRYRRPSVALEHQPLMAVPEVEVPVAEAPAPTAVRPAGGSDPIALTELPTGEFWTIKREFEHEESRRLESLRTSAFAAAA